MSDLERETEAVVLEDHAGTLARHLARDPEVVSVVLLGSAARAECAWATVDGHRELFSDIELLAITRGRMSSARRRDSVDGLEAAAARFGYANPRFHADVLFRERRRLASMPPFVFTYELAANGRTLTGPSLLGELPLVDLGSLDRRNTHEILMKRLWALAEAIPAAWVRGERLGELQRLALAAAFAREPLDVTTVLLPEAGILRPTYRQRVAQWALRRDLPFRGAIDRAAGGDSGAVLADCLARRADLQLLADEHAEHARAVAMLASAIAWLLGTSPDEAADRAARDSRRLFHEWPVTAGEWLALARQGVEIGRRAGVREAAGWLTAPRKGLLTAGLLHLHQALVAHAQGRTAQARDSLDRAAAAVAAIDGAPVDAPRATGGPVPTPDADGRPGLEARSTAADRDDPFAARWLNVRLALGRQFWRSVRLGDATAARRLERALGT